MIEIDNLKIERTEASEDGKYAAYVAEPLLRGFGTTIGNALRRVLLSSLPGVAVTSIRIDGVNHEFSTLPGVKEDVTEIVLNLKALRTKLHSDGPKTVYLEAKGPKTVCAGDITPDADVEIVNPEQHIATLDEGAELHMEIVIDKGRGYVTAEQNKQAAQPIGYIPMDSIFTPVRRVNYKVEDTRVGQDIDYDRLTLEVWTDGVITPDEAVSLSAKILSEHLNLFANLTDNVPEVKIVPKHDDEKEKQCEKAVEELDLTVRSFNCLKHAQINTVKELCSHTEAELLKVRNLGAKSLTEIVQKLAALGLKLKDSED